MTKSETRVTMEVEGQAHETRRKEYGAANSKKIECACGKMLARMEDGVLFMWCKSCRKEVAYVLIPTGNGIFTLKPKTK